jgi:hypothetical protein
VRAFPKLITNCFDHSGIGISNEKCLHLLTCIFPIPVGYSNPTTISRNDEKCYQLTSRREFTQTSKTRGDRSSSMPFDTNPRNTLIFLAIFILAFFPRSVASNHKNHICEEKTPT